MEHQDKKLTDFVGKLSEDMMSNFLTMRKDLDELRKLNETNLELIKNQQAQIDVLKENVIELSRN